MYGPMARFASLLLLLPLSAPALAARIYDVLYDVNVVPARQGAEVTLVLKQPRDYVRELDFSIDPSRHEGFAGDGFHTFAADDSPAVELEFSSAGAPVGGGCVHVRLQFLQPERLSRAIRSFRN